MFIPSTVSAGALATGLVERDHSVNTEETLQEAGKYFDVVKPYVWGLVALGALAIVENIALLFCCLSHRHGLKRKEAADKLRQQETQAVEQLKAERAHYERVLAREQQQRGEKRNQASTKPPTLAKNYLSRAPSPEEIRQKRQARKDSSGSDADASSFDSLPLRQKSGYAQSQSQQQQQKAPPYVTQTVGSLPSTAKSNTARQSTLNRIDQWAQPATQSNKTYGSPSSYSQVSESTFVGNPQATAAKGRERLLQAVKR